MFHGFSMVSVVFPMNSAIPMEPRSVYVDTSRYTVHIDESAPIRFYKSTRHGHKTTSSPRKGFWNTRLNKNQVPTDRFHFWIASLYPKRNKSQHGFHNSMIFQFQYNSIAFPALFHLRIFHLRIFQGKVTGIHRKPRVATEERHFDSLPTSILTLVQFAPWCYILGPRQSDGGSVRIDGDENKQ